MSNSVPPTAGGIEVEIEPGLTYQRLEAPSDQRLHTYAVKDEAPDLIGPWNVYHEDEVQQDWPDALFTARVMAIVAKQVALLNSGMSKEAVELFGAVEVKAAEAEQLRTTAQLNRTATQEVPC